MALSYIPLIGADNVIAVTASGGVAGTRGTINGVAKSGRPGQMRTALLVAMDDSAVPDIPATTSVLLFSVKIACPPGFSTGTDPGTDGFDYSALMPFVRAECIAKDFESPAGVWPVDITAFLAEEATLPPNITQVSGRLTEVGVPTTTYPYGTLTFAFSGAATTAAVTNALVQVMIDFGAGVAN